MSARATEAQARLVADAFMADPFYRWLVPREHARLHVLRALMRRALAGAHVHAVYEHGDDHPGVCLALTAVHDPDRAAGGGSRAGRLRLASLALHPLRAIRAARFYRALVRHRPREPHVHLELLAVAAAARGRGLAGTLLRALLADADARGLPVHLETTNPDNLGLYARFGFAHIASVPDVARDDGPRAWIMRRPAVAAP